MQLLKDQAYDLLLGMIEDGRIRHGETYSLNAVASDLGMSRTPVRDAIQRMCDEGRMDLLPSRGFQLHRLSKEEMEQHYHFSNAIEGYCVLRLAKYHTDEKVLPYVEKMKHLVHELGKCLDASTPFDAYFRHDKEFHLTILESLEDPYFSSLQYSAMGFYDHPELQMDSGVSRREVYQCHKNILDCIESGDPHGAYDALIAHADLMLRDLTK